MAWLDHESLSMPIAKREILDKFLEFLLVTDVLISILKAFRDSINDHPLQEFNIFDPQAGFLKDLIRARYNA
tara:strand:+ start:2192 stop:2407 length:216 start_codon:yes stop_codon:yes gene_type:complete